MPGAMKENPTSTTQLPATDEAWQDIEDSLDEIARLAKTGLPVRQFHGELLERLVRSLAALGAAVWTTDSAGQLRLAYQLHLEDTLLTVDEAAQQHHHRLLVQVLQTGQAQLLTPHSGDDEARNPTSLLLLLGPLMAGGKAFGVVEIFQRPESRAELLQGYLQILTAACELASDFHRERALRDMADRDSFWQELRLFSERVHASLDLDTTAMMIANEGRRLIAGDRVSVVVRRGAGYRLAAVSGVDTFHPRATVVRLLESLVRLTVASQEILWHPGDNAPRAPQMEAALDAYLDESHARFLAVVPLRDSSQRSSEAALPHGALVVERFTDPADDGLRTRLAAVCPPAATALRNAWEFTGIPLLPILRAVRRAGWYGRWEQLPKTLTAAVLLLAAGLVLALVPADFSIAARGELQPQRRYQVFAPTDGVVSVLAKGQGESVREGEALIVLTNPKLDLEFTEVVGKRRTTEEQLAAVRAARLRNDPAAVNARDRFDLTAQEEQLKEKLTGLEQQYQILSQQRRQLEVRSPTRGQILTWDIERSLAARPVQRGEKLLTVADLEGAWEVELRIDDDQAGHVLTALGELGPPLHVSYILATNPGVPYEGQLRELATATEVDDTGHAKVGAIVDIADATPAQRRPGATVIVKIHCGRRALGYVWFRPLFEAWQSRWLF